MQLLFKHIFLLFFIVLTVNLNAQTESVTKAIGDLKKVWELHYKLSDSTKQYLSPSKAFLILETADKKVLTSGELQQNIRKAEVENYRHNLGLGVNANYLENFNPGLGEDDDNLIYNRRLQGGITWNLLNNGWIENRMLADKTENEIWLNNQNTTVKIDKKSYTDKWNRIIYLFNTQKIEILNERKSVLNDLEKSTSDLYLLKFITRENYLNILSRKTEVESMYNIYADYNQAFDKLQDSVVSMVEYFPVFDINYDSIIQLFSNGGILNDSASILFDENLRIEKSLVREIQLNTSLKYNYYNLITDNPSSRQFLTFGINFAMPIPFHYKQKRNLAEARAAYSKYVFENSAEEFHREVLNDCYEYRYKLKQLEGFYQKKNLLEEKLRRFNALKDIHDLNFNPVEALNTFDEYLSVKIELVDLTQNLYLKFHRINSYFSTDFDSQLTKSLRLPSGYELDDAVTRSVYIWSSAFEKHSDVFIREYLIYNKFEKACISIKEDTTYARKLNKFILELFDRDIKTEMMIGDNHLINASDYLAAIDSKMKSIDLSKIESIHLDVEPHTFDDWESNKTDYLKKYILLIQKARIYCDNHSLKLSVSIPLHYPEEITKEIFTMVDWVYFMAYENIKPEYIQKKTDPYKEFKNKWVIAASVKDFTNRPALEQHLIDLYKNTECINFAIHDFNRLVEMDEQNIEDKK